MRIAGTAVSVADRPEVGQTSQYKRVCRYQPDGRAENFRVARHAALVFGFGL